MPPPVWPRVQLQVPHRGAFRNAKLRPVLQSQELPGGPRKLGKLTFEKHRAWRVSHSCQAKRRSVLEQTCLGRRAGLWAKIKKELNICLSASSQQSFSATDPVLQGTQKPVAFALRKPSRADKIPPAHTEQEQRSCRERKRI